LPNASATFATADLHLLHLGFRDAHHTLKTKVLMAVLVASRRIKNQKDKVHSGKSQLIISSISS